MTKRLYHEDAYISEFEAEVIGIDNKGVVLDQTAFYPGGGGQPNDTGSFSVQDKTWQINKLSSNGGEPVHEIEDHNYPNLGDQIHGAIDWTRRYQLMRTHTALHILCGVIWRDYRAQVTGGDMKPLSARMDFELERISADFAREIEQTINEEVKQNRDVKADIMPREEAMRIPDLIRTKVNLIPQAIAQIRTVNIKGLDLQADGGLHVSNTTEVGYIRVVKHESKGRINKRLRIEIDD